MKCVSNFKPDAMDYSLSRIRHWRWLVSWLTALADAILVFSIVYIISIYYHLATFNHYGNMEFTIELVLTLTFVLIFTKLIQGRHKIARYLTLDGQILDEFNVWNVAMLAFAAIGFMTKVIDHYSRSVIVIT
jgi:hypothetical protein